MINGFDLGPMTVSTSYWASHINFTNRKTKTTDLYMPWRGQKIIILCQLKSIYSKTKFLGACGGFCYLEEDF